jgi:hypothetical protein
MRDETKAKLKAAAQRAEQMAEQGLVAAETKWPVGVIVTVAVCCFVLGMYVRGLFH